MEDIRIENYSDEKYDLWNDFVIKQSINGTFLQTKKFLNYHKNGKFKDVSLLVYMKNNILFGVIPACECYENGKKVFFSHGGSTFGGIVINKKYYNIKNVMILIKKLEEYLSKEEYDKVIYKNTSGIFNNEKINLVNYMLYNQGYDRYDELSFVIDYKTYNKDILSNFDNQRKRGTKKALKNNLRFKRLQYDEEIETFYLLLENNLKKFNTKPVHSLKELLDFKNERLPEIVEFYGVFENNEMIAGSMVFNFQNKVFHTQYLAANQERLELMAMNYLYYKLIEEARNREFEYLSWGISTEDNGKVLNEGLASFKEGFGSSYFINTTYYKQLFKYDDKEERYE